MEHRRIIRGNFLPTNENRTVAIEPTMRSLHYPTSGFETFPPADGDHCLPTFIDVRCVPVLPEPSPDPFGVISLVQAHMLRICVSWLWSSNRDAPNRINEKSIVMPIRRANNYPNWNPSRFSQDAPLRSLFSTICRVFACFFSPATGALTMLASSDSQFQLIPMALSYFCNPFFQKVLNTPAFRHS